MSFCYIGCLYGNLFMSTDVQESLWMNISMRVLMSVYGSLCVSMGVYESLWGFKRIYGIIWVCGWVWVLWNSMGVYGSLCASMRVYGSIWSLDEYEYIMCGFIHVCYVGGMYVCLWVYANFCVFMGAYGGIWVWDLSTHEVPRDTYKYP